MINSIFVKLESLNFVLQESLASLSKTLHNKCQNNSFALFFDIQVEMMADKVQTVIQLNNL